MSKNQLFGYFNGNYYTVDDCNNIVIPENMDYKTKAIQTQIHDSLSQCEIDIYRYHSDIVSECNSERVAFMKDFLINEKITNIDTLNKNFVIGVEYELFNKSGQLVKSGTMSILSKYCTALINSEVKEDNLMEYRKAFVFDGRIEIPIPVISRYGIKNSYSQHPYTIRFKSLSIYSGISSNQYLDGNGTQVEINHPIHSNHIHHASHAHCYTHGHGDICHNNFASNFITNAKIGTTIIDQLVVPAELEVPKMGDEVKICTIPFDSTESTIKIDHKIDLIVVNLEVLLDNYNVVYDYEDIAEILKMNINENITEDELPDIDGGETSEDLTPPSDSNVDESINDVKTDNNDSDDGGNPIVDGTVEDNTGTESVDNSEETAS